METRLLTESLVRRLMETSGDDACVEILKETVYADYFGFGEGLDLDRLMEWRRSRLFNLVENFVRDENFNALLRIGYDYHNMRVMLKKSLLDIPDDSLFVSHGIIPVEIMKEIFISEQFHLLPPAMEHAVTAAVESWYRTKMLITIDLCLDASLFHDLIQRSLKTGSSFIHKFILLSIDMANIKIFARAGDMRDHDGLNEVLFIDGGNIDPYIFRSARGDVLDELRETAERYDLVRIGHAVSQARQNPFAVERECDNTLTDYLRAAQYLVWGAEPVFTHAWAVELELRVIGILLSAIRSGLGVEWIEMRLPETMVRG
jgi:V/A-type H+-transporting ATPase subunit C